MTSPGVRSLCVFIRDDYLFSVADTSNVSYPSVEILDIFLYCSLDAPILIINLYRHPNHNTPFSVYSILFDKAFASKYALIIGDFNAHHYAWGDR